MIANFDYFNNPVDPKLFVCNPDKTILAPITRYTDSSGKISLKVNACYDKTSDLSVAVYKYVGEKQDSYTTTETYSTSGTSLKINNDKSVITSLLQSGRTSQTVTVQGKNLCNENKSTYTVVNGYYDMPLTLDYNAFKQPIQLQLSQNYTLSAYAKAKQNIESLRIYFYYTDGTTESKVTNTVDVNGSVVKLTFSVTKPVSYVAFARGMSGNGIYVQKGTMQIELGSTATAYAPFVPNSPSPDYPSSITGVTKSTINGVDYPMPDGCGYDGDSYDYVSGTGTASVGEYNTTGTDSIIYYNQHNGWFDFTIGISQKGVSNGKNVKCNRFPNADKGQGYFWGIDGGGKGLFFVDVRNAVMGILASDTSSQAISKIQAWFLSHPMQMTYQLATLTAITGTPQSIPSPNPTIITNDQNANMNLTYTYEQIHYKDNMVKLAADCYQYIDVYRQIHVENLGYFVITSCTECNDGLDPYYEVTAQSCEIELNNKQIKLNAGIYKFYDALYPSATIMGKILELCPSWKLGSLPQNIQGKFRTFDDTKESVYGFLSTTLEKAFGCIIDFDIENRIINVIDSNYEIPSADILLDFDNILTNVKINQSKENIITNLTVTGGNDLDISEVNPTGEDYIVDFSYYKNLNWMSQNLINAIDAWKQKIASNNTSFNSILANLKQHQTELESLDTQLTNLQDELKALESQKSDLAGKNQDYSNIQSQINSKNTAINNKNNEIMNKQSVISSDYTQLHTLQNSLRLENNFTTDQFEELNHYIFQNEYKNDNITVDKDTSYSVKQEAMMDLYFDGFNKLNKLCQPASDFEIDAANFLLIKDFDQYRKRFDLGKAIDIKLSPNNIVRFLVLQYGIDYDNLALTIKLSNQLKINDRFSAYQDMYNKVTATSNTISKSKDIWNYPVKSGTIAEFDEFRSGVLNATLNKVVSSDNEEIAIDNTGIHGRSKNSITGKYEPEQLWINKNNIMFSDDGFKSAKMAVGKMQLPNGTWVYGFNGDAILAGTIDAARLNLTDYAKFTDLSTAGSTTINGNNITTGKIQSNNGKVYFDLNNAIISASQLVSKDAVNNALKIGHVYTNTPDTGWGMALYDERSRMVYTAYNVYDWYVNISSTIPMQIFSGEWGGTHSGVNLHSDSFEIFTSPDGGYSYGVTCLSDGSIEIAGSSIVVNGNFSVLNGSKNAVVTTKDYGDRAISAYETAEYYFGDIGYGKIEDGECRIDIDPVFAQCVNTEIDYHVFLTCVGDAANIYVAEMNKDYFIVKSDKDVKFSYEIKAKRLGYEDVRLKEFELKKNNTTA